MPSAELEISIRRERLTPPEWAAMFSFFEADPEFDQDEIVAAIEFDFDGTPDDFNLSDFRWCGRAIPASVAPVIDQFIREQHDDWLEAHIADRCGYVWTGCHQYDSGYWRAER